MKRNNFQKKNYVTMAKKFKKKIKIKLYKIKTIKF